MAGRHENGIVILASGSGSTAEAFIRATQEDGIDAKVGLVICNNPPDKAGIYERVAALNRRYGLKIPVLHISGITHPVGNVGRGQTLAESEAICGLAEKGHFALVALMGYMKKVNGPLMTEWGWRPSYTSPYQAHMLNTHPGPLPETTDTYGIHTSERVLELGMPESRHTVHVVAPRIDEGPIVAEYSVPVVPGDTAAELFARVQRAEKAHLPPAIGSFLAQQREYHDANA